MVNSLDVNDLLRFFGARLPEPKRNLRKAEPFHDLPFRAIHTDGSDAYDSFLGSEFETKLNEAKDLKLNLIFLYRCPSWEYLEEKAEKCKNEWHEYCIVIDGNEYVHWLLADKMGIEGGSWFDEREVREDGQIGFEPDSM